MRAVKEKLFFGSNLLSLSNLRCNVVAEAIGQRFQNSKGLDIGHALVSIHSAGTKRNRDICSSLLGRLLDGRTTTEHYQVSDRNPLAIGSQFPSAKVVVQEDTTANLLRRLHDGEVDAVIAALPIESRYLQVETLFDEELKLLVSRKDAKGRN